MTFKFLSLLVAVLCLVSCSASSDKTGIDLFTSASDFQDSQNDWNAGFSDYKILDSASNELKFSYVGLPSNLDAGQKSFMLSGKNTGNNLFMFLKKKIGGLQANTEYILAFDVDFASNSPQGAASGDSVKLKAGASSIEPKALKQNGFYRMNIDKGEAATDGSNMIIIGTIGVADSVQNYSLVNKGNSTTNTASYTYFKATTNSQGELWLIVGTDSSFKGTTTLYYARINVVLSIKK